MYFLKSIVNPSVFKAEKLSVDQVNEILSCTETKDDDEGLIDYARKFVIIQIKFLFIHSNLNYFKFLALVRKIMAGPFPEK